MVYESVICVSELQHRRSALLCCCCSCVALRSAFGPCPYSACAVVPSNASQFLSTHPTHVLCVVPTLTTCTRSFSRHKPAPDCDRATQQRHARHRREIAQRTACAPRQRARSAVCLQSHRIPINIHSSIGRPSRERRPARLSIVSHTLDTFGVLH